MSDHELPYRGSRPRPPIAVDHCPSTTALNRAKIYGRAGKERHFHPRMHITSFVRKLNINIDENFLTDCAIE
ncbi:hypothetical protein XENTR_v10014042 [Xenopus tropicalis]|nr:hypothetical protein XENTR_v10014042 [Xenopus tropicalis]